MEGLVGIPTFHTQDHVLACTIGWQGAAMLGVGASAAGRHLVVAIDYTERRVVERGAAQCGIGVPVGFGDEVFPRGYRVRRLVMPVELNVPVNDGGQMPAVGRLLVEGTEITTDTTAGNFPINRAGRRKRPMASPTDHGSY